MSKKKWQGKTGDQSGLSLAMDTLVESHELFEKTNEAIAKKKNQPEKLFTLFAKEEKKRTRKLTRAVKQGLKEIKRVKTNLKRKSAELQKISRELLTFRFLFNHNLQEPLRNLQMIVSVLMSREATRLSPEGKQYIKRLDRSVKMIRALIKDLLEYSNTGASTRLEKTDLNVLLTEVKQELADQIRESKARIQSDKLCNIRVVPYQLRTIFRDLISNSIKFAKPGREPRIKITSETNTGARLKKAGLLKNRKYAHITFSDNGIGFDQKFAERIFGVFEKLHGPEYKGTGIGLAIAKKIVDNHNGIICASGIPGKGATFHIYLPVSRRALPPVS